MNKFKKLIFTCVLVLLSGAQTFILGTDDPSTVHVWEMKEIHLTAEKTYDNFYTDVDCWVELKGPGFSKRVYGFWNGGNNFIVRIARLLSYFIRGSE